MTEQVTNNMAGQRYELVVDGKVAFAAYGRRVMSSEIGISSAISLFGYRRAGPSARRP